MDYFWMTVQVLGGLGMFMYGMKLMSDGLEAAAGDRMRSILEKTTANRFMGVLVGTAVTALVQSSSATTVMVVGFVNARLMSLVQAIGVIMGANIGTTITGQIVALKMDMVAPIFVFAGMVMVMFLKSRNFKRVGLIVLGFGILFMGMSIMGEPLKELSKLDGFKTVMTSFSNPFLAVIVGMVATAVIQSSSAATGIIITMYAYDPTIMPLQTALFLVLGTNIGTCITAIIASISTSRESKRAALAHVLFNVTGTVIVGFLLAAFPAIMDWLVKFFPEPKRTVAMFHTLFNFSTVAALIGFVPLMAKVVQWMIPEKEGEGHSARRLLYLDKNIVQTPAIAASQAHREVCRMSQLAQTNLEKALEAFNKKDAALADEVVETESIINYLNHQITAWLVRIRGMDLPTSDLERLGMMFHVVSDIERIGDHAENIAEYAKLEGEEQAKISPDAMLELRELADNAMACLRLAVDIYETYDEQRLPQVDPLEQKVDDLAELCVDHHIKRLMSEKCDPRGGVIFTDMVSDLERISDHATNIAYAIVGETVWDPSSKQLRKISTNLV